MWLRCLLIIAFLTAAPCITQARQVLHYGAASCAVQDKYGAPLRDILPGAQGYLQPVGLDEISQWFILAVLAAEDKRFFEHGGVDIKAAARAAAQNIQSGAVVSGASTITQQLVSLSKPKNKTLAGKINQAFLARKLEGELSKEQILEAYFNSINFGGNIYGAQAAARVYFDTSAAALSPAQAALLAGIIKSPSAYNPRKNFDAAKKRQKVILGRMFENGFLSADLYRAAVEEPLTIKPHAAPLNAPHYAEYIKNLLPGCEGRVTTTIDGKIQGYIEELLPVYVERFKSNNLTNASVVVLDNATGAVLALAGSADYFDIRNSGAVNGATALRQPGSALKPFVYAGVLQAGLYTASTKIRDEDKFFPGGFRPRNYDEAYHGYPSLREALACSYNIPAVQAAQDFGVSKLLKLLHAAGFISLNKTTQDYGLGLALGNGEVTLLELANAYRAVANNGLWTPLVFATQPQLKQQGRPAQFITPQTAFIITDILADNKARAAAFGLNSPLALPFAFAAKTGTSKDYRDNWAIGYNPRFTIAVWTGNFNGAPMRRVSGITGAAPLLRDIAMFLQQHYPAEIQNNKTSFIKPAGIVEETICLHTGLKAGKDCKHTAMEFYLEEYKPAAVCAACAASVSPQPAAQKTGGIIFPQDGDVFMVDPALPPAAQQIALKAAQPGVWKINGATLPCKETKCFWPLQPGDIELIHTPPGGKQSKINFTVL